MKPKRLDGLFATAGGFLLVLALAGCGGTGAAPQVAVSPTGYDFGPIGPEPVTTVFTVRNEGDGPLQIESVSTSCGCTTAQIEAQTIAPGTSAALTVTFDPQAHAGSVGQFVRYVYLRTDDPARPEVELEIRADVIENPASKEVSQ
jgi:hypothetical protein